MKIQAKDTIALMVDFQEKLMPVISHELDIIKAAEKLGKGLRVLNVPVMFSQQYTKGLGMTVASLRSLALERFDYYDKIEFSCYQNETIRKQIEASGKRTVIVAGAETHICVQQTVTDLLEAGYQAVLAADCTGSRKDLDKSAAIERMRQEGAVVTTCEALLFELTKKAGTPAFKGISAIIK